DHVVFEWSVSGERRATRHDGRILGCAGWRGRLRGTGIHHHAAVVDGEGGVCTVNEEGSAVRWIQHQHAKPDTTAIDVGSHRQRRGTELGTSKPGSNERIEAGRYRNLDVTRRSEARGHVGQVSDAVA